MAEETSKAFNASVLPFFEESQVALRPVSHLAVLDCAEDMDIVGREDLDMLSDLRMPDKTFAAANEYARNSEDSVLVHHLCFTYNVISMVQKITKLEVLKRDVLSHQRLTQRRVSNVQIAAITAAHAAQIALGTVGSPTLPDGWSGGKFLSSDYVSRSTDTGKAFMANLQRTASGLVAEFKQSWVNDLGKLAEKVGELTVGQDKLLERDGEVLEDPELKELLMKLPVEKISTYVKEIEAQIQVIGSLKVIIVDTSAFVKLCTDSKRLVLLQFVVDSILKAKALTEFSARVDAADTILKAHNF